MLFLLACVSEMPSSPRDTAEPLSSTLIGPWTPLPDPVLEGRWPGYATAGDPSVVVDGDGLRMFYTDYAEDLGGADIWTASSSDGVSWVIGDRALQGRSGEWDGAHETVAAVDTDLVYAIGYPDAPLGFVSGADLGRFRRTVSGWVADPELPVVTRTPGGLDADGITSPSIVADPDGGWVATWTGWCFSCDPVVSLLGARSDDGVVWTRFAEPLVTDPGLDWADGGVAETQLVHDEGWWLLFSSVDAELPHRIGLASAPEPEGPWTFEPQPLLVPEDLDGRASQGVLAPHYLRRGDEAWLWFSESDGTGFRIGLAAR
ncbi:MAG: hypothetical protein H6735_32580 [Alphaproteobacteria bacterium]|nr:hypothetical protein [Alphaproteobacteria bacterium]